MLATTEQTEIFEPMETEKEISNEAIRFASLIKSKPLSEEDKEYLLQEIKGLNEQLTNDYILATLFPDYYDPTRFPMMFPNPTAVFRHHDYLDVKPGKDGKILIQVIPHMTWFEDPPVVGEITRAREASYMRIYTKFESDYNKFSRDDGTLIHDKIGDYFESVVLRAAVVRVFYVGSEEKMSGFLTGSIDYHQGNEMKPPKIEDVEDGYYKQFGRPVEGMRVVWFPKDYNDCNFEEPNSTRKGSNLYIYGSGLDDSQELRIDVIRHFEGFPLTKLRDYIDVKRPSSTNAQSAMETMGAVHNRAPKLLTVKPKNAGNVARRLKKKSGAFNNS